jgi:hypothetical protein
MPSEMETALTPVERSLVRAIVAALIRQYFSDSPKSAQAVIAPSPQISETPAEAARSTHGDW